MTATQTLRDWWATYRCDPGDMERFPLPTPNGYQNVLVATEAVPVFAAISQIMGSEPYLFREMAGGTYNCRSIGSSGKPSLHSYGIALDLNPSKNPHKSPLTTDMPDTFIKRMEGIKANGKKALVWGGRWSIPDAMHYQIDVSPADCKKTITWDKGETVAKGPNGEPNWDKVSDWAKTAWTEAWKAGILSDTSDPKDVLEMEQLMVTFKRAKII